MAINLGLLTAHIIATFTVSVWVWWFGFFKAVRATVKNMQDQPVVLSYRGNYRNFEGTKLNHGYVIAFYRTQALEYRIAESVYHLMKMAVLIILFQVMLIGFWWLSKAEHAEWPTYIIYAPWSEAFWIIFFVFLYLSYWQEWKSLEQKLPS